MPAPNTDDPKIRDEDRSYEVSTPEANRSIEQGNGVGARDIAAQQDPTRGAEEDPFAAGPEDETADENGAQEGEAPRQEGPGFF